jgi:poly-gamma-glutamate synthesis protein (capsule biosynthesis protein)
LVEAGFDFVSTANNHCYDKGERGMLRTLEILDRRGIDHAGTYASPEDQAEIFVKNINGVYAAFLSYTYSTNGIPTAADWQVNMLDEELMKRQISEARMLADIVIVLPHMGNEYELTPASRYKTLAQKLCDWGADAVMASHPHVIQPIEIYTVTDENGTERTCFIAYSMGNFISGQRTVPRDAGAVFYLEYEKANNETKLVTASYAPTWVQLVNNKGQYDICVLSVYDALHAPENYRPQDINRMKAVHRELSTALLGVEIPFTLTPHPYLLFPLQ